MVTVHSLLHPLTLLLLSILLIQRLPNLPHTRSPGRQHAILQAIQVSPFNRREKLPGSEIEQDARADVVAAEAGGELEVLVEDSAEGERDGMEADEGRRGLDEVLGLGELVAGV